MSSDPFFSLPPLLGSTFFLDLGALPLASLLSDDISMSSSRSWMRRSWAFLQLHFSFFSSWSWCLSRCCCMILKWFRTLFLLSHSSSAVNTWYLASGVKFYQLCTGKASKSPSGHCVKM